MLRNNYNFILGVSLLQRQILNGGCGFIKILQKKVFTEYIKKVLTDFNKNFIFS